MLYKKWESRLKQVLDKKKSSIQRLEQRANNPQRCRLDPLAPGSILNLGRQVNIQSTITHVGRDINLRERNQPSTPVKRRVLVEVAVDDPADEQGNNHGRSEVALEEGLGTQGSNGDIELGNKTQAGKEHTDPTANDTEGSSECKFFDIMTVVLPCRAETDVGVADTSPDEQGTNTGQGKEPVEDNTTSAGGLVDESKETKGDLQEDTPKGAAGLVDVGKEIGSHAARSESLNSTSGAESSGVGDTDDGEGDDSIHDRGQTTDTGILDGDDEGGSLGVGTGGTEQVVGIAGDDQADDEGGQEVEDHDTPEDLLGGLGEGLGGVGGFGSSETSKLRSTESKSCGREDGAEALEGGEGTGVVPVVSSDVSTLGGTTAVDHDSEDDETDDGNDLDETENEFNYKEDGLIWADLFHRRHSSYLHRNRGHRRIEWRKGRRGTPPPRHPY